MTVIQINTIANFVGRGLIGLMGFLFIPLYIKYLGEESYGLITLWGTLSAVFSILDVGVCATLNREMARLSGRADGYDEMRDLLHTLERINWCVACFVGLAVMGLSFPIAKYWVNIRELSLASVQAAVFLIGIILLLQWPITFYNSGLNGLQRQGAQNIIVVTMTGLRNVGVLFILAWVSPTIQGFFGWQIAVCILQFLVCKYVLWHSIPQSTKRARFRIKTLIPVWRFALGMSGITLVVMLLTQMNTIVLSKMITLDELGYYGMASSITGLLGMLVYPVFTAVYPRLSQLVAIGNSDLIQNVYHKCCQMISVGIISVVATLLVYTKELLFLWTKNEHTVSHLWVLVSILAVGAGLNGLTAMPYALQLANGKTAMTFWNNLLSVIVLFPCLIYCVSIWGAVGAACIWVLFNIGCLFIYIPLTHYKLLPAGLWKWYIQDVGMPMIAGSLPVILSKLWINSQHPILFIMQIFATWLISITLSIAFASALRDILYEKIQYYYSRYMTNR